MREVFMLLSAQICEIQRNTEDAETIFTYVQVKVAVFESQIFQSRVVLFNFIGDMLDERCNDQHAMPQ